MNSIKVLLVEDDDDLRTVTAIVLEEDGYVVLAARDALEALKLLDEAAVAPDVIVTDLRMPRMNGWQFQEHLQKTPAYSHIPLVVATGEPVQRVAVPCAELVLKPFTLKALMATIDRVVTSSGASRAPGGDSKQ